MNTVVSSWCCEDEHIQHIATLLHTIDQLETRVLFLETESHHLEQQCMSAREERDSVKSQLASLQDIITKTRAKCRCKNSHQNKTTQSTRMQTSSDQLSSRVASPIAQSSKETGSKLPRSHPVNRNQQASSVQGKSPCPARTTTSKNSKTDTQSSKKLPKVSIISSSMGRGLSSELNSRKNVSCYASVNPSAGAEQLAHKAPDVLHNSEPDIVVIFGQAPTMFPMVRARDLSSPR